MSTVAALCRRDAPANDGERGEERDRAVLEHGEHGSDRGRQAQDLPERNPSGRCFHPWPEVDPGGGNRREQEQAGGDPERRSPPHSRTDGAEHGGHGETEAERDAVEPHRKAALRRPGGDPDALQACREEGTGTDAEQHLPDEQGAEAGRDGVDDAARQTGERRDPHQRGGGVASERGTADEVRDGDGSREEAECDATLRHRQTEVVGDGGEQWRQHLLARRGDEVGEAEQGEHAPPGPRGSGGVRSPGRGVDAEAHPAVRDVGARRWIGSRAVVHFAYSMQTGPTGRNRHDPGEPPQHGRGRARGRRRAGEGARASASARWSPCAMPPAGRSS